MSWAKLKQQSELAKRAKPPVCSHFCLTHVT